MTTIITKMKGASTSGVRPQDDGSRETGVSIHEFESSVHLFDSNGPSLPTRWSTHFSFHDANKQ